MPADVRARIEAALAPLVGLPLWDQRRALDLQGFHFGAERTFTSKVGPRKGQTWVVGEYALHLQCAWRIVNATEIIVGSRDRLEKSTNAASVPDDDWDWSKPGANLRDERLASWLSGRVFTVESIRVDAHGGFALGLSTDVTLEVFPETSFDAESWRLLSPGQDTEHFVVIGSRIED